MAIWTERLLSSIAAPDQAALVEKLGLADDLAAAAQQRLEQENTLLSDRQRFAAPGQCSPRRIKHEIAEDEALPRHARTIEALELFGFFRSRFDTTGQWPTHPPPA